MTDINPTIPMITLNINGLNTLKKERLSTRNPSAYKFSVGGYQTPEYYIIRKSICGLEGSQEVGQPMEAAVVRNQSFL